MKNILNIKKTSWTGINALIYIVLPKLRVENVLFIVTKVIQIHGVYNYIQYYILYIIDEHIYNHFFLNMNIGYFEIVKLYPKLSVN